MRAHGLLHGVVDLLEVERLEDVPLGHDGDGVRAWRGLGRPKSEDGDEYVCG